MAETHPSKRLLDVLGAALLLLATLPILLVVAVAIPLADPGPVLYRARRVGRGGRPFDMLKFRTMRVARADRAGPRITRADDDRVFPFGAWLRRTKIDELPQLVNVLRGEMSLIGPRPEDPYFVAQHYTPRQRETLAVRPGLSSPGSLYHDAHCTPLLAAPDVEGTYVRRVLPVKLALDLVYVRDWSLRYDLRVLARTVWQVLAHVAGRHTFPEPPELARARATRLLTALLALALGGACTTDPGVPPTEWIRDPGEHILVGAGDIAYCDRDGDEATADILDGVPGVVFTAGDNAYPNGTAAEFANCYGPSWGRHRARTRPTVGNHEYFSEGAAPYFAYFGNNAGTPGEGYYSYDIGPWHVVALNSEIAIGVGSPQLTWLAEDLAEHPAPCTAAIMHRPLFASTERGGDPRMRPVWELLYAAGVDVAIASHEHMYERFAPQSPVGERDTTFGIRQFIVGTGGAPGHALATPQPNSEVRAATLVGVLALRLLPDAYAWRFVAAQGSTFSDSGTRRCHGTPPAAAREGGAR